MKGTCQLDWLNFTWFCPPEAVEGDIVNVITAFSHCFPEFDSCLLEMEMFHTVSHYTSVFRWNDDFIICYNDDSYFEKERVNNRFAYSVNVQVPSHSLELLFNLFNIPICKEDSVSSLLSLLKDRGCKFSRIDLAFDDYDKKYLPDWYMDKFIHNALSTNFQTVQLIGSKSGGWSFYVGSLKKRNKILRIYDKDKQSNGKYKCVRYEFELHSDNANDLANYIIDNKYVPFGDYLRGSWFDIKDIEHSNDSNFARMPSLPEWLEFVEEFVFFEQSQDSFTTNSSGTKLRIPHYNDCDRSISLAYWVEKFVLPSVLGYRALLGEEAFKEACKHSEISDKWKRIIDSQTERERLRSKWL